MSGISQEERRRRDRLFEKGLKQCTGGQAVAVGVSLTLLVVIAVAVAVLAWRRKVLERHRTPSDRYRHAADDLRQLHDQIERDSDRRRDRHQRGSSGGSGI